MTTCPPETSTSLLAKPTRFPRTTAWYVASKPATPTIAEITVSTSSAIETSTRATSPDNNSGHSARGRCKSVSLLDRRSKSAEVASTAAWGRNSAIWEASNAALCPATRAYTRYRWRLRRTTSRVLVPMDPVDPRMVSVFIACGRSHEAPCVMISRGNKPQFQPFQTFSGGGLGAASAAGRSPSSPSRISHPKVPLRPTGPSATAKPTPMAAGRHVVIRFGCHSEAPARGPCTKGLAPSSLIPSVTPLPLNQLAAPHAAVCGSSL